MLYKKLWEPTEAFWSPYTFDLSIRRKMEEKIEEKENFDSHERLKYRPLIFFKIKNIKIVHDTE